MTTMIKRDCHCNACRAAMDAEFKRIVRPLRIEKINARREENRS